MKESYFIAGTDTGVGKTTFAVKWLNEKQKASAKTLAFKPVASGSDLIDGQLQNEDALLLQKASTIDLDYKEINPVALQQPISPNIAAELESVEIEIPLLVEHYQKMIQKYQPDSVIVEGAGGWYTPINDNKTMADLAVAIGLPVILVVDIKLGCLNHALLTIEAIQSSGLSLAGWYANCINQDMLVVEENIATIEKFIGIDAWSKNHPTPI